MLRFNLILVSALALGATAGHAWQSPEAAWQRDYAEFVAAVQVCEKNDCDERGTFRGREVLWKGTLAAFGITTTTPADSGDAKPRRIGFARLAMNLKDSTVANDEGVAAVMRCCLVAVADTTEWSRVPIGTAIRFRATLAEPPVQMAPGPTPGPWLVNVRLVLGRVVAP